MILRELILCYSDVCFVPYSTVGSASDALQGNDALACRFGASYTVGATAVSSAVLRCETPVFTDATINRALTAGPGK